MKKILLILLVASILSGITSAQPGFVADNDKIVYNGEDYSVKFGKSPFSVTVSRLKDDVMKIEGIVLPNNAAGQKIASYDMANNQLSVVMATADNGYYNIRALFHEKTFDLHISAADMSEKERIGLRFDTKTSGHWYGGAVVKGHQWPLEQSSFEVDPFFGTSNQASPVWYTSSGAGIISATYNTMGYSFNKPGQGFFDLYS
jgi:hypothetical protein